jgi:hypothetical protein
LFCYYIFWIAVSLSEIQCDWEYGRIGEYFDPKREKRNFKLEKVVFEYMVHQRIFGPKGEKADHQQTRTPNTHR